jgi:hypothetical protein
MEKCLPVLIVMSALVNVSGARESDRASIPPSSPPGLQTSAPLPADRPLKVRSILIEGEGLPSSSVIIKRMKLLPGQAIDSKALERANKRLASLNATAQVIESAEESGYSDILVKAVKK